LSEAAISGSGLQSNLLDDYTSDCELQGLTPESIRRYLSSLGIFLDFINRKELDIFQVEKEALKDFIRYLRKDREVSYVTIKYYFSALSSFYSYLRYEDLIDHDPIHQVRKRYLRSYKRVGPTIHKQLISVEQMSQFVRFIMKPRDKALVLLLAKTGIRRAEAIGIDLEDINFIEQSINLKHHPKRTNTLVFFDAETNDTIQNWLISRERITGLPPDEGPLFVNSTGARLRRNGVYTAVTRWAKIFGIHDPKSRDSRDRFNPHSCRHWFTTHLRRAGMCREFRAWLRGDRLREAQDAYDHIDPEEVRLDYLQKIPYLGLY